MDDRVNDMLKVMDFNDAVLCMYDKLAELEKNNKVNTEEYNDLCDLIRYSKRKVKSLIFKYPINDDYMDKLEDTLTAIDHTDLFFYDYNSYLKKFRHRRLFEFLEETSYLFHTKPKEYELQGKITIDGVTYDLNNGLYELDEDEYDSEDVEDYKELIRENTKYDENLDDYSIASIQLESNIFIKYLLEAIEKETNVDIKDRLIDVKYNILSTISCLEDSFLVNHSLDNSISHYHRKLDFIFKRNNSFYPEYIDEHKNQIIFEQDRLMGRNKNKYNSIDEKVFDILIGLTIKTHLSCIPDKDIREELVDDNSAAVELTKSNLDKKILKKSIQLNKQYTINNPYI
ncbi:MAG: hypothetical protein IKP76_01555 [Bacilli bacterium]|nr:hypothetical protein [Bacilli bacterium]